MPTSKVAQLQVADVHELTLRLFRFNYRLGDSGQRASVILHHRKFFHPCGSPNSQPWQRPAKTLTEKDDSLESPQKRFTWQSHIPWITLFAPSAKAVCCVVPVSSNCHKLNLCIIAHGSFCQDKTTMFRKTWQSARVCFSPSCSI